MVEESMNVKLFHNPLQPQMLDRHIVEVNEEYEVSPCDTADFTKSHSRIVVPRSKVKSKNKDDSR
jgi:RAB protein geranylgeranyltransferase component A